MNEQKKDQRLIDIGQRLKNFRKFHGYKSQEAFAIDVGVNRSAYSHYESGHVEPTGAFLHNLSTKFGADINYILTGKSEQETPDFDTYLTRMGVDDMMKTIIKEYMKLPDAKRKTVKEYIETLASEITKNATKPNNVEEVTAENLTAEEKAAIKKMRIEKNTFNVNGGTVNF